jgi:hypothetical protein
MELDPAAESSELDNAGCTMRYHQGGASAKTALEEKETRQGSERETGEEEREQIVLAHCELNWQLAIGLKVGILRRPTLRQCLPSSLVALQLPGSGQTFRPC